MSNDKYYHIVRIDRDNNDYILPKGFFSVLVQRFFPVISLLYIASIFCISVTMDNPIEHMFFKNVAYIRGALIVMWCSIPAIVWILLVAHPLVKHVAGVWYKIMSGVMIMTIGIIFVFFPESQMYGMRDYFILSFPAFFLIYFFLVFDQMPMAFVYPLNALGVCAFIWALSVGAIFH